MSRKALCLVFALLSQAGCATLEGSTGAKRSMPDSSKVDCASFARNPDGTWRTLQAVKLGKAALIAGEPVPYGIPVNGVDLTVILTGKCVAPTAASGPS